MFLKKSEQFGREVADHPFLARVRRIWRRTIGCFANRAPTLCSERTDFPFIVVAPQCPWNTWWPELADGVDQLLSHCATTLPIDQQRLYLTGLSMGGYGCWYLGALWPTRFAAIAPICGGGLMFHGFPKRVEKLKNTPTWAFHGANDDVVPLAESQKLVDALRESGGIVKFTVYPHAGHDSWTETYNNPELYSWLLSHRARIHGETRP